MANAITSTTTLQELIPEIVTEAQFVVEEQSLMRGLVRAYNVPYNSGKTVEVPFYGQETAKAVAENVDLDNDDITAVDTSSVTLTVSEAGLVKWISDMSVNTAQQNIISDIGKLCGDAIARKMDQDLLALFAGFSTTVGTSGAELTAAGVFQAIARLRARNLTSDVYCVLHPFVAFDLKDEITSGFTDPNAGPIQNQAMVAGYLGTLGGVPVYESSNITINGSDDYACGMFHRDALGLATLKDISIEFERNASMRSTELVATAVYGVGELRDLYGVQLLADSSIV